MSESVAILGLGLMGGSLGLALRGGSRRCRVAGYARRPPVREGALAAGAVDSVHADASEAVAGADWVVLCTPVLSMPGLVREIRGALKPGCILTDVGSTKAWLAEQLPPLLDGSGAIYVGSHPMAGSDRAGLASARGDLYQDARVMVSPPAGCPEDAIETLCRLWESVGARVMRLTPERHDACLARTSHLPHLAAALLVAAVDRDDEDVQPYCGPGFLDSTRIAGGPEDVWHDIVKTNADAVKRELKTFRNELERLEEHLARGDFEALRQWLADCRRKREAFQNGSPSRKG